MSTSPEGVQLPSPECTLPSSEQVNAAAAKMHRLLFEAALKPMLPPRHAMFLRSNTNWEVEESGLTLLIGRSDEFGTVPTLEELKTKQFVMDAYTASACTRKICRPQEDGALSLFDDERQIGMKLSEAEMTAGSAALQAFLEGEIAASRRETIHRFFVFLGVERPDEGLLQATEKITQVGEEPPRTEATVEVKYEGPGYFSFRAHMAGGVDGAVIEYEDRRDYDGPFGINPLWLTFLPQAERIELLPPRQKPAGHLPERVARDRAVDASRKVLTTGRLREVQQYVEAGLQQLAEYHTAYVTRMSAAGQAL